MRLYIVDDAAVMRAAIGHVASSLGHAVVGEAASLEDALVGLAEIAVDVVVVDGRLPTGGREAIRQVEGENSLISGLRVLCRAAPAARIIVIAALDETTLVARARAAGAAGALLRPVSRSGLAAALAVVRGDSTDANT